MGANEAGDEARLLRGKKNRIPEINWNKNVQTKMVQDGASFQLTGKLNGTLTAPQPDWNINVNKQDVVFSLIEGEENSGERKFSIELPLTDKKNIFTVEVADTEGKKKSERIIVVFPKWNKLTETITNVEKLVEEKRSFFEVSLGASSINYSETGITDFSETVVRTKLSYYYQWRSRWAYLIKTVGDVLPVASTPSGMSASFINSDLLLIYSPPWLRKPWSIEFAGGIHHSMMFSSKSTFGYAPILYPQIYPSVKRRVSAASTLALAMGYTPLSSSISKSDYEFQAELSWLYQLKSKNSLSLSFDYRDLKLSPKASSQISLKAFGLNFGYGW
ncbi:MAG: hypothetical protein ACLGGX_08410 [Bdellovibrionia bacterium]